MDGSLTDLGRAADKPLMTGTDNVTAGRISHSTQRVGERIKLVVFLSERKKTNSVWSALVLSAEQQSKHLHL